MPDTKTTRWTITRCDDCPSLARDAAKPCARCVCATFEPMRSRHRVRRVRRLHRYRRTES